ncbi:hypothetical protein B0F90DRAFT_212033 [Multifurca ochricompacta]|uniref:Uncharacterized protein n=1 Tax=Multifurca ochricompacta TaxID=376703 RepID=A0AAD4QPC6_9AGAM|nr:hypothetical protein B0F90DRAFT_212033 [Multifurca ochricompacta]
MEREIALRRIGDKHGERIHFASCEVTLSSSYHHQLSTQQSYTTTMPSSGKSKQPTSARIDINSLIARPSMDPDILALFTNQMKLSLEKKNNAKNAKIMRAARDQLEKLLSSRAGLLEKTRIQLETYTQEYLTGYARDLDEIRSLWAALIKRREALVELLCREEKVANQLELERERDSVGYLAQAKADCEERRQIIAAIGRATQP